MSMEKQEHIEPQDEAEAYETAPWFQVSTQDFISIEHPFVVRDISRSIETLGGPKKLGELISGDQEQEAQLWLHPGDKFTRPIQSGNISTENLLLRLRLPKRTGRRRKKGSGEPFVEYNGPSASMGKDTDGKATRQPSTSIASSRSIPELLQQIKDNFTDDRVEILGRIGRTHRFRSLPDFVYSTERSAFMNKFKAHIQPLNYESLKRFQFDTEEGHSLNGDLVPPPRFSKMNIPFNYYYQQNPNVKKTVDESGNITMVNESMPRGNKILYASMDDTRIPERPSEEVVPLDRLDENSRTLVQDAKALMEERPIWTRRALSNQFESQRWQSFGKLVYQYIGYEFRTGPWREAVTRFGVDPRSDPKYRIYQTMSFQIGPKARDQKSPRAGKEAREITVSSNVQGNSTNAESASTSHIFDGKSLALDGKTFQSCDIVDPLLRQVLDTPHLRKSCHAKDGWYHNGTWAKIKAVMRAKLLALNGEQRFKNLDFSPVLALPEIIDLGKVPKRTRGKAAPKNPIAEVLAQIRISASTPEKDVSASPGSEPLVVADGTQARLSETGASVVDPNELEELLDPRVRDAVMDLDLLEQSSEESGGEASSDDEPEDEMVYESEDTNDEG